MKTVLLALSVLLLALLLLPAAAKNPVEVGDVKWARDFDASLATSAKTGKPIFAFFQEVPGCAGCRKFGSEVMTNPALVKAIENEFVPVLIYNNRPGNDAEILRRFGEPAWNYQVIRFLDAKGADIIPRRDGVWTTSALAARMIETLEKTKRPVPGSLRTLTGAAATPAPLQTAAFSMFCFWTGEMKLGQIEGVTKTEAGWLDGHEVTLVKYDPALISFNDLVAKAKKVECAREVYTNLEDYRPASKSDQKKQLQGTPFARLTLTPEQATKVNAFARNNPQKALTFLTPAQRQQLVR